MKPSAYSKILWLAYHSRSRVAVRVKPQKLFKVAGEMNCHRAGKDCRGIRQRFYGVIFRKQPKTFEIHRMSHWAAFAQALEKGMSVVKGIDTIHIKFVQRILGRFEIPAVDHGNMVMLIVRGQSILKTQFLKITTFKV